MAAATETMTVHVPMTFRKRGARKQVITPDGHPSWAPPRAQRPRHCQIRSIHAAPVNRGAR
jgi:hypothetical protein